MAEVPVLTDVIDEGIAALVRLRSLSKEQQFSEIAALLQEQHGWLRRGVDMKGPFGQFTEGREFTFEDFRQPAPEGSHAALIEVSPKQLLGHPFIRFPQMARKEYQKRGAADQTYDHSQFNYFHLYDVRFHSSLGVDAPGLVSLKAPGGAELDVPVTQEQIDANTKLYIQVSLSI